MLPYYTASGNKEAAVDVAANPGTESLVLWFGLIAALTLVPGLYSIRDRMAPGRLRTTGFTLAVIGYLCLPGLLAVDLLLWVGTDQGLSTAIVADLADGVHPAALVATGLFVPTHIIGIVLIGVLALRSGHLPKPVAWLLVVSQPLHLASIILGLPALDLVAWSLTALGMAWLAATLPAKGMQDEISSTTSSLATAGGMS
ncbi:hypothetical protein [Nocardioides panacisoli]|uniref:hypothetical protein n=1 Tax=Nocardioides panacisoli TaxID=627624 RepID=UPI0031DC40F3